MPEPKVPSKFLFNVHSNEWFGPFHSVRAIYRFADTIGLHNFSIEPVAPEGATVHQPILPYEELK